MTIQTGHYIIISKATKAPVGRARHEDHSLRPKPIVVLPKGEERRPWIIIKDEGSDDTYTLRADGAPVANIDGRLFAELIDEGPSQRAWKIQAQPQHGPNTFIIVSAHDQHIGWFVTSEEPYAQLDIRPLIATKSLPPQYLDVELFEIVRLLED